MLKTMERENVIRISLKWREQIKYVFVEKSGAKK